MASYFTLTIDTTGPDVEIITPDFVLSSADLDIVIQASEGLEPSFQEFTLIDSLGQHHSFILTHFDNIFKGKISLSTIPLGIATIVVQVRDLVLNLSPVVSKTVHIVKGAKVNISGSVIQRKVGTSIKTRAIEHTEKRRSIATVALNRDIGHSSKTRIVKVVVK